MITPDYNSLREKREFTWRTGAVQSALLDVTEIPIKEFNTDPSAGIEFYRKGRAILREMLGPDIPLPGLSTPAISYGHVNGLGAELLFPDDGEVNHTKPCSTLQEGIDLLKSKRDVDFATAGMAPFYLDYREKMTEAFDGEVCGFSYGPEGPLTTAYALRGTDVFYDPYDDPGKFKEFLHLLTESIIKFVYFRNGVHGIPAVNSNAGKVWDDISAMFSPKMWPEFILPALHQYFDGITTGNHAAHIEGLCFDHLPYLEDLGIIDFDPSISPQLNPKIIRDCCRIPFEWRLGSFHYPDLSCQDVEDFVFQAAADGADNVHSYVEVTMCNEETLKKVHSFIKAAKEAKQMLDKGATREQLGACVSESGKKKFWDHWPE